LVITIVLYALKVPGSILIGIFATAILGLIPFFGATTLPSSIVALPQATHFFAFDFVTPFSSGDAFFQFFIIFFTFLFVDIFDTVGTLVGVAQQAGLINAKGEIPKVKQAFIADAVGTVVGACTGTSTVTSYVESTAGVAQGGRTGLTALVSGILFVVALFLSPLFLMIPSAATAPALILVGFLMMGQVVGINFKDPTEGIPCFLAIAMMPFAYSIAEGIVFGLLAYVILKACTGKFKEIPLITWALFVIFILRFIIS
jgi:AGZA family xanthine/uracil permease-like MFS transporter